jgi:hypothetical protein
MVPLPDGTFSITGDTIEILAASRLTRERLVSLAELLNKMRAEGASPERVFEAVAKKEPSLQPLLEKVSPRMRKAFVLFLIWLLQTLATQGLAELRDDAATKNDVRQAVELAIQRCIEENKNSR